MAIRTAVNRALTAITALPTAAALTDGNLTLLTTATASSSATLDFTSNINSTYNNYLFKFINLHPSADGAELMFQANAVGGSGFNETVTTTFFLALHNEADGTTNLVYEGDHDSAQGTAYTELHGQNSSDADHGCNGSLTLFNPSSTTFVKHFFGRFSGTSSGDFERDDFPAGYFNTAAAIDEISFKFSSGNIDSGTIKMYGVGPKQS
jgi:hypothetical protein